jgi:hypothetical protein
LSREHYFTVEGPKGKVDVFEVIESANAKDGTFEPTYEVVGQGKTSRFSSEGEAITVAQEMAGVSSRY